MNYAHRLKSLGIILTLNALAGHAVADVNIPHEFQAGERAVASEVNENFKVLADALNGTPEIPEVAETPETEFRPAVDGLIKRIEDLEELLSHVELTTDSNGNPLLLVSGANVQVVNGDGPDEAAPNGLGNLIVGYDVADGSGNYHCTVGTYGDNVPTDESTCAQEGGVWTNTGFKTGSHNLVMGRGNNYSSYGAIVAGDSNTSNAPYANVLSGRFNTAQGWYSSVSGGHRNQASGHASSISGGGSNKATNFAASVSGGDHNEANADSSSVSGGNSNKTQGFSSSILGGSNNTASGEASSVSGGGTNLASGRYASISGGGNNKATNNASSVSGGDHNEANGDSSSVSGGSFVKAESDFEALP